MKSLCKRPVFLYQIHFYLERHRYGWARLRLEMAKLPSRSRITKDGVMKNHLLALGDFTRDELRSLIDRALVLKAESKRGIRHQQLAGRKICLLFEKPSTRTRVSFEAGMYGLGGQVIFMSAKESQLGRGEPLERHGPGAVPLCRCHRGPHLRPGRGGRTGPLCHGAGDQCPDRSAPSLPGAQRPDDRDRREGGIGVA